MPVRRPPSTPFHVDTLCDWFPGCSIIHIVRDPRDVVSSLIRMPWANRSVVAGAHAWHSFNMAARAGASRDNYLLVKYEELVSQAEDQLRRISSHVGLPFHEALLEARPVKFAHGPVTARAHEGITTTRVELWRRELRPWQVAAIEKDAGRGMDEFGCKRESKSQIVTDWAKATWEAWWK